MKKEIKKFLFNNGTTLLMIILSIFTLIIGSMTIGLLYALLFVVALNLLWFLPNFLNIWKRKNPKIHSYKVSSRGDSMKNKPVKTKKKKENKKKTKIWKKILLGLLILFIIGCILGIAFMFYIAAHAPKFDPEQLYHQESTIVYDKDGNVYAKLGAEKREIIQYNQMSEQLINAIVATEDSRFFTHNGFDLPRFAVASAKQLLGRTDAGGASTLTMQVVKNHFTSTEDKGIKGIIRKFTDIYMSIFQVEKKYSKEEILEFYANSNYLGGGAYGVEQASVNYFGKHAKDLNVAESALIAGLFQAPNYLDPYNHPDRAEKRRKLVLSLMQRHGYITEKERKAAEKLTVEKLLVEKQQSDDTKYQAFLDTVASEVEELTGFDPYSTAMEIYTTMDKERQDSINEIMNGTAYHWENDVVNAGISVLDIQTGAIVAIGGGRNKSGAKSYNTATMTKRQIGSTAKPLYDYGPGMEFENWSTYQPFVDEPYHYSDGGEVGNWDGAYKGFLTSREAIMDSRNIPALKAFQANKNSNIKKFVQGLGLSPEVASNGTLHEAHAIGGYNGESPLSLSAAYAAFGNGGYYNKPYSFTKVKLRNSDKEYTNKHAKKRAMSDSTAYMMTDILVDTSKSALGRYSDVNGITYAAKTGTTNFTKETKQANGLSSDAINDLWCIGYSPEYAIAVWYGYDKIYKDHYTRFGNREHTRLFQAVAKKIFTTKGEFKKPDSVSEVTIEYGSNPARLASDSTPDNLKTVQLFKKGTEPTEISTTHLKLKDVSGLTGTIKNGKVSISWNAASGIHSNTNSYGALGYDIYRNENGNLVHIKFTTGTSFSETLGDNQKSVTYVVKTTYQNKKDFASKGSSITLNEAEVIATPVITLLGDNPYMIPSSVTTYKDPGIKVTVGNKTLDSSEYQMSYALSNGASVDSIMGQTGGEAQVDYTVVYKVIYNGKTYTKNRQISIMNIGP